MNGVNLFRRELELIIVGAIIFIASFLWKDIVVDFRDDWFPQSKGMTGRVLFTAIISLILIMFAVHLKTKWEKDIAKDETTKNKIETVIA